MGEPVLKIDFLADKEPEHSDGDDDGSSVDYIKISFKENGFLALVVWYSGDYREWVFEDPKDLKSFIEEYI